MKIRILAILLLLSTAVSAAAEERFVAKLQLPTGQTVVVAEGDFEARSIGSFSVRLYQAAEAADATTFFVAGLVSPRDGGVESVTLADINGDQQPEIIVTARSAGSGGYLTAYAFTFSQDTLVLQATVEGLNPGTDPTIALRNAKRTQE